MEASNIEGLGTLKNMLQMKADKIEIEKLYEVKTSKIEFENILDIQQVMSKQFRHIVILFIEIVSCWTHKINDTK